jgi:hypothetical protein
MVRRRLSAYTGVRVITEDGVALGRLIDLRAAHGWRPHGADAQPIAALVCGRVGWLERIGLRAPKPRVIAWQDVIRVSGERVIVRSTVWSLPDRLLRRDAGDQPGDGRTGMTDSEGASDGTSVLRPL